MNGRALTWICLVALSVTRLQGQVRLGIVATDDAARGAAELMTAALTGPTNVALVERTEVDKTFREQALAADQRTGLTRLGRLLHADGLVLMQLARSAAATILAVRLVSVNSGVVLDAAVYPLPLQDPVQWSKGASARMLPFLPKLKVPQERAVAVSLLNLRAAVATPESAQTERLLSTLLFHRLALEPEIFVLERRQMGWLQWEKELALDEKPFWSGGYLLEGLIDRDGTAPDTVTIHARLVSPNEKQRVVVDVSGPRRDLPSVVERLAGRILSALQRETTVAQWDRNGEAERFEQESSWALRWGMWPEGYAAAESAWALGRHTESVARMKLQALLARIHPDDTRISDPAHRIRYSNGGRQFDPIRNVGWTTNAPAPTDVPLALEAVSTFAGQSQSTEANWRANGSWLSLGSNVLRTASGVIRHQYLYGWREQKFDEDLPVLREATRNFAAILPKDGVREMLLLQGGIWQETPQAGIQLFREALASGDYARERQPILARGWENPFWVGWTPADRERGALQWTAFIAELQSSTNRLLRADGALLKLQAARFDPDIAMASEEFLDVVMDENRFRFTTNVDFTVLDAFHELLSSKCSSPTTLRRQRLLAAWKEHEFARMKHYLQTARIHNMDRAGWPYARHVFTQDQARELLPVVEDYIQRTGGASMSTVRDHVRQAASKSADEFDAFFAAPNFDAERFRQVFVQHQYTVEEARRLAYPVRAYANRVGWTDDLKSVDARLQAMVANNIASTNPAAVGPSSAVLKATRFFQAEFKEADTGKIRRGRFVSWRESQGKIYAVVLHPLAGAVYPPVYDGYHVLEVDLASGRSRLLPETFSVGTYQQVKFAALGAQVFWIDGDSKVGRLDCRSGALQEFDVDLPLWNADVVVSGGRLFLTSNDFVAEFFKENGSIKLLVYSVGKSQLNDFRLNNKVGNWY